jgi:hypothetical protein
MGNEHVVRRSDFFPVLQLAVCCERTYKSNVTIRIKSFKDQIDVVGLLTLMVERCFEQPVGFPDPCQSAMAAVLHSH